MKLDGLAERVARCAEMGMAQCEIADLLRVSPSTIRRIVAKIGIKLNRKRRVYGPDITISDAAGEGEQNNDGRATKPSIGSELEDEAGRAARAAKSIKIRNREAPDARLKRSLRCITNKYDRYEITYAHKIMEFEKLQFKLGNRESLPAMRKSKETTMPKSAIEMAARRKSNGIKMGERLLKMLTYDQRITASEASVLLDDSIPRTSSYLTNMWEAQKVYRVKDYVLIEGQPKRQWRWVYCKSLIKPLYSGFEDER